MPSAPWFRAADGDTATRAALDNDRLAGGELAVHSRGADADALLASALTQTMKLGAVKKLAKNARNLSLDDTRPIVGDFDPETVLGFPFNIFIRLRIRPIEACLNFEAQLLCKDGARHQQMRHE